MSMRKYEIISAGRSEAEKMKGAVAGAEPDARVTMTAGQFATLAGLIENLCAIAADTIDGGMGDPRYWVPLEEYARLKRRQEAPAARAPSLEATFADILDFSALQAAPRGTVATSFARSA